MSFKSEYLRLGQVAEITPGKHKNVVTSKIPLVLNILLGRKRCSCEQMDNIPRRLNNVVRNFAHLRISVTDCDITCLPSVSARTHPIGPFTWHKNRRAGEQKSHWGQDRPRKLPFKIMYAFCLSCLSATFALQRGCFVPHEWLAAKGLF